MRTVKLISLMFYFVQSETTLCCIYRLIGSFTPFIYTRVDPLNSYTNWGRRGRDQQSAPITTNIWVRIPILDTTICDKVCQWLAAGLWFTYAISAYHH